MSKEFSEEELQAQSNTQQIASFVSGLLLPNSQVTQICDQLGYEYRERIYSPMVTIWLFVTQVLSRDHSCQQAVNRFNAYRVARGLSKVATNTTAYCKARGRLPEQLFSRVLQWSSDQCEQAVVDAWLFHERIVEIVDGWTLTMADTEENQDEYPQQKSQRKGCGFPIIRMVGLFSLATGSVRSCAFGAYRGKQTGETSLLRSIFHHVLPGRILLADRYYASFWLLAQSELRQIDLVARAHQLRKIDFRKGLKIGYLDQLVAYDKPARPSWMNKKEYNNYPATILVRHLRYKVHQKGFRTREITLVTTLLDAVLYRSEDLAELFRKRWQVELHLRSLKMQMQMDHLRCKSPQMVRKEVYCHMIGFNLVRATMVATALRFGLRVEHLSFTNVMQTIEEFANCLRLKTAHVQDQWHLVLQTVAAIEVGQRPGRKEERVLKRRQKNYKLMKSPRNPNRNRYATSA